MDSRRDGTDPNSGPVHCQGPVVAVAPGISLLLWRHSESFANAGRARNIPQFGIWPQPAHAQSNLWLLLQFAYRTAHEHFVQKISLGASSVSWNDDCWFDDVMCTCIYIYTDTDSCALCAMCRLSPIHICIYRKLKSLLICICFWGVAFRRLPTHKLDRQGRFATLPKTKKTRSAQISLPIHALPFSFSFSCSIANQLV